MLIKLMLTNQKEELNYGDSAASNNIQHAHARIILQFILKRGRVYTVSFILCLNKNLCKTNMK